MSSQLESAVRPAAQDTCDGLRSELSPEGSSVQRWPLALTLLALIAGCSAGLLLWITRSGIGLGRDSRAYLRLSRLIQNGGVPGWVDGATGAISVETHYPPGYPMLLAKLGEALHASVPDTARWVNASAMALSIGLMAALAARTKNVSRAILAAILLAVAAGTWQTHTFLLSEAVFGSLLLATFLMAAVYFRRRAWPWLVAAATCAGLSVVVRYAGVALVLAGVVAVVLAPRPAGLWRRRLIDGAIFTLVASIPMALWVGWYTRHTGTATSARPDADFHPPGWEQFSTALASMAEWFGCAPRMGTLGIVVGSAVLVAVILLAGYAFRQCWRAQSAAGSAIALPLAYFVIYPAFLTMSVSFFDSATPFDQRILYPMHVAAIALLAVLIPMRPWWSRGGVAALVVIQLFTQGMYLRDARDIHLGYNGMQWQREPVIQFIRALPRGVTILTDNVEVIELAAERSSIQLPRVDGLPDPGDLVAHKQAMAELREQVPDGAYLILINRNRGSRRYTPLSRLAKAFQLKSVAEFPTGPVFLIERPELKVTRTTSRPAKTARRR